MSRVGLLVAIAAGLSGCTATAVPGGVGGAGGDTAQQGTPTGSGISGSSGSLTSASSATGSPTSTSTSTMATGGATTGGSGSTTSGPGSSSSGAPCLPSDCIDGNPCTIDGCAADGSCTHDPRAPGTPGDLGEAACEGVCQTDTTCGLALYHRDLGTATWTKEALSSVWNGANAPPPRGIRAADGGTSFDLFVVADDNQIYQRIGGAWVAPVSVPGTLGVQASEIDSCAFWNNGGDFLQMTLTQGGIHRYLFATVSGASITGVSTGDTSDIAGYPSASLRLDWQAMIQSPTEGLLQWYRFEDGNVYRWNMNGFNGATPEASSDAWGDPATAPPPGTVRAALIVGNEIQFVAP